MPISTHKALLVIADISGFTQFMKSHENAANHAMQVVVELLKAVISAAAPPLKLAELEGDAAFFYAVRREDRDITQELIAIKKQVMGFFRSFYRTLHRLSALNRCALGARDLRLKVIIHAGEVAIEHIHGFDKLFGMDVILAHRLLKNSVPAQEYVLLTEAAYNWLGDFHQLEPVRQTEYCEGIGVVETAVIYPPVQFIQAAERLDKNLHSNGSHSLPYANSFQQVPGRFWALPDDCLGPEQLHRKARAQPIKTVWVAQLQTKWRHDYAIHVGGQGRQELRCGRSP